MLVRGCETRKTKWQPTDVVESQKRRNGNGRKKIVLDFRATKGDHVPVFLLSVFLFLLSPQRENRAP